MRTIQLTKNDINLKTVGSVKEIIRDMHGLYDDHGNWISLDSGKVIGVVNFINEAKGCAIVLNAKYQSLNAVYLDDDFNLHISDTSIGGVFWGNEINEDTVKKYNDSIIFEGSKIKSFVTF